MKRNWVSRHDRRQARQAGFAPMPPPRERDPAPSGRCKPWKFRPGKLDTPWGGNKRPLPGVEPPALAPPGPSLPGCSVSRG